MRFQCENCKLIIAIDDEECGQQVLCGHCHEPTYVPKDRFSPNAVIDEFVITRTLGHGGMGTVYLAYQVSLDRQVALKILMEQFSGDSEFITDFVKEARAAARLNHPNIVQSYAVGEENGIFFFAMEYVEGETLKQLMDKDEELETERIISIIQQIAEALDFAWKNQKLVHRDIKPDNIMLTSQGVAKLADLGLARVATELLADESDEVMGTPQYICPEQLLGQPMDVRGDIYSLGATLYHVATGKFPFAGNSPAEIARKHLQAPLIDPQVHNPELPASLSWTIKKMMARDVNERYQDAASLAADLGRILRGEYPTGFKGEDKGKKKKKTSHAGSGRFKAIGKKSKTATRHSRSHVSGKVSAVVPAVNPIEEEAISVETPEQENGEAAAPQATSGGTQKRFKRKGSTMRFKSKNRTKTQLRTTVLGTGEYEEFTDGDLSTTEMPSIRPGRPTKKSGGIARTIFIILVLILVILGGLGLAGVILYNKYTPKTVSAAENMYLALPTISAAEQKDYLKIKPYIGKLDQYQHDPEQLNQVADLCHSFIAKYPQSLFCRTPGQVSFSKIFGAPAYFEKHLSIIAPLVGIIRKTAGEYDEAYVCSQRALKHKDEEKQIKNYRYTQSVAKMGAQVESYIKERQDAVAAIKSQLQLAIETKVKRLAKEQLEVYDVILDNCKAYQFDLALRQLMRLQDDTKSYGDSVARKVKHVLMVRESDKGNMFRHALAQKLNLPETLVNNKFQQALANSGIEQEKLALPKLSEQEKNLFDKRDEWFNNLTRAVKNAQRFHDLVASSQDKLEGQKLTKSHFRSLIRDPNILTRLQVRMINRDDIVIRVMEWSSKSQWFPAEIKRLPLVDIPYTDFCKLAQTVWGKKDPAEFSLLQGCFSFFLLRLTTAQSLLSASGEDDAQFLLGEFDRIKPLVAKKTIDWTVELIKSMVKKKNLKGAKILALKLKKRYGSHEEFQKKLEELNLPGMP